MVFQLKQAVEGIIPRKYLRVWGMYTTRFYGIFLSGKKHQCSCCKKTYNRFLSYGLKKRENALCPWCLSLERHRLMWIYLQEQTNIYTDQVKVLHFAPEHQLQEHLSKQPNIDYTSADLDMPTAMVKMDITNITFESNTFDVILCNHVLEHIPDDAKAMSELFKVLKPGGWAILQTPMSKEAKTIEDVTLTDPKEMERRFGQNDHVRIYGLDKKDRLEAAGFEVVLDDFVTKLPKEVVEKHYLEDDEIIYLCKKPK